MMLSITSRHQSILNKLQEEGYVNVLDLCKALDVSAVTIRKDLKLLEEKGLLFRSHGGASMHNPYINEKPVNEKEYIRSEEKIRIGKAAAQLILPDDTFIIASGTTVLALARHIKPVGGLTAITASLNVALELNRHPEIEVLQLGGSLRKSSFSVAGSFSEMMLENFSCSKLFLGIDGIDLEFGISTTNILEAQLNQKMISASQKTIVLADSSKFGRRGFGKICNLDELDQIITDKEAPDHDVKALEEMGIEVTMV
jgi:DeoR family transcriptional regulator of aga operon